ncbi:MAG TPA: carbohydrate ABC transporter permease [Jiangellales bacterium]|nr:carbohydrate ABC transporter permease [Jiangellales bacterium]
MSATTAPGGVREKPVSVGVAFLVMAVFAVYFLLPVWWLVVAASKGRGQLASTNPLWFSDDMLLGSNIADLLAFRGGIFLRWVLNSLLYAGLGALLATLFAAMAGYALAKYAFRGREVIFNVILGGVLVPATALALPLFLIFSRVDQTNTFWAVFLPSLVSPFGVYLARIYAAASVPEELIEAARLDGSGEVRTFFSVALRLMGPALVTIYLFQFVYIWNNFFLPLIMLQDQRLFPVTLGLYAWNTQITQAPELRTYVIVGALVSIVPLIVAFLVLQRFWQSGLAAGGVK